MIQGLSSGRTYRPTGTASGRLEGACQRTSGRVEHLLTTSWLRNRISLTSRTSNVTNQPHYTIVHSYYFTISENFNKTNKTVPTGKLLNYPATLLDIHNHNQVTNLYRRLHTQVQNCPLQLCRRFETVRCASASKSKAELTHHYE